MFIANNIAYISSNFSKPAHYQSSYSSSLHPSYHIHLHNKHSRASSLGSLPNHSSHTSVKSQTFSSMTRTSHMQFLYLLGLIVWDSHISYVAISSSLISLIVLPQVFLVLLVLGIFTSRDLWTPFLIIKSGQPSVLGFPCFSKLCVDLHSHWDLCIPEGFTSFL